jgi:hypothetical protein
MAGITRDDCSSWQIEAIREAVEKADAGGPFVSDEDARRYLDALARGQNPEWPLTFQTCISPNEPPD